MRKRAKTRQVTPPVAQPALDDVCFFTSTAISPVVSDRVKVIIGEQIVGQTTFTIIKGLVCGIRRVDATFAERHPKDAAAQAEMRGRLVDKIIRHVRPRDEAKAKTDGFPFKLNIKTFLGRLTFSQARAMYKQCPVLKPYGAKFGPKYV